MNIDFHTHVKLTKKTAFSPEFLVEAIGEAKANGLHAMAMTEHFNTLRYGDIYDYLDSRYAYQDDCYDIDGFKLFPGMEVDVRTGGHILMIGSREAILELRSRLEPHCAPDQFVALEQLLDWSEPYREQMLIIGAHPFRESNPLTHHHPETLGRLDALDLNATDLFTYGSGMWRQVEQLAQKIGIPCVAGSDTHHPLQFGSVCNRLSEDAGSECARIRDLTQRIRQGHYQIIVSPCLETKVKAARLVKRLMKQAAEREQPLIQP